MLPTPETLHKCPAGFSLSSCASPGRFTEILQPMKALNMRTQLRQVLKTPQGEKATPKSKCLCSCPGIIWWITSFGTIMTVGVEVRGFGPLFCFRTGGKMSKERSQSSGAGTEQSTEVWLHFLRLPLTSTRRLIQCNLALFWWLTPTEILPTRPRGGDGDGAGGRKWHPPKPVGDQLILKIISDLHFTPAPSLFTFHKPGRMGSRFKWLYRPISPQMGVDQINLPQLYFTNSLGRELCRVDILCKANYAFHLIVPQIWNITIKF